MSNESETPELGEVIDLTVLARLARFRVALPAKVVRYYADEQSADLQVLTLISWEDEDGERRTARPPVINRVPVMSLGGGGFRLRFPIAQGDQVLAVFASTSLDRWKTRGGDVDPLDTRTGDLSDAIAIPGLHDFAHPLEEMPASVMRVGRPTGPEIEIGYAEIRAGGSSKLALHSELVALRDHVAALLVGGTGSAALVGPAAPATPVGTTILKGA